MSPLRDSLTVRRVSKTDMSKIAIVGASGHGRTVLANFLAEPMAHEYVFLDDDEDKIGTKVDGVEIIAGREKLCFADFLHEYQVIIAIGDPKKRHDLSRIVAACGGRFITSIHPSAVLCQDTVIDSGSAIMPHAMIGAGVRVGRYCVVNNNASIGHMSRLEDGASVNDGCRLGGSVVIGEDAYLGMSAVVVGPHSIGARSIVGAGAVVLKSVPPDVTVAGVPARIIKHRGTYETADRPTIVPATG